MRLTIHRTLLQEINTMNIMYIITVGTIQRLQLSLSDPHLALNQLST
jgi:hypothetical protein